MCYGDVAYGRDGYYEAYMEQCANQAAAEAEAERQQMEIEQDLMNERNNNG